jgi:aminoglycoside 6'-N-acetyltransferase
LNSNSVDFKASHEQPADYTLQFKPLIQEDLNLMFRWFQEPIIKQWYARGQQFSLDDIKNKYLGRILGQEHVPSFIVYKENNPIGFIQYYYVSENLPQNPTPGEILSGINLLFQQYNPQEVVGIDLFIAEGMHRGKGLGQEIIGSFITQFLSDFKAVIVDPIQSNKQAIQCYEKAGFKLTTFSENPEYLLMIQSLGLRRAAL